MNDNAAINRASPHACQQAADNLAARTATRASTIRLPSQKALADDLDACHQTARHATTIPRQRGPITSVHGRGTFAAAHTQSRSTSAGAIPDFAELTDALAQDWRRHGLR